MGKSDILGNIQNQASVKEDLLEAIVGAVAIDCHWDMNILEKLVTEVIDIESILEYGKNNEEDNLPENFVRCHKSFIANVSNIASISLSDNVFKISTPLP